jgi:hypothetical protein
VKNNFVRGGRCFRAGREFILQGIPLRLRGRSSSWEITEFTIILGSQSWFEVSTRFKQVDINAPTLFNIFLDSTCRCTERARPRQIFTREPDAVTNMCGVWTGDLDGIA